MIRTWAGGAKLTLRDAQQIQRRKHLTRDQAAQVGERLGVTAETVYRCWRGFSWHTVKWRCMPAEWKVCSVCGKKYERRFKNGRHRSNAHWAQKKTCGQSCSVKRAWLEGKYDGR